MTPDTVCVNCGEPLEDGVCGGDRCEFIQYEVDQIEETRQMTKQTLFNQMKTELKTLRVNLTFNSAYDEYRVNVVPGTESTAYYTDDLQDAFNTGKMMSGIANELRAIERKTAILQEVK